MHSNKSFKFFMVSIMNNYAVVASYMLKISFVFYASLNFNARKITKGQF